MTTSALAAGAYQRLAGLTDAAAGAAGGLGANGNAAASKGGFGAMLQEALNAVGQAGSTADARTAQAVQGKGDMVDVVTAVSESQVALETLVSVRDRVISAYEDILRMQI